MSKLPDWLQTDVEKATLKSKYYKIGTNIRLFASQGLSRNGVLKKLLNVLNVQDVLYKYDEFVSYYSKLLKIDFDLDENVVLLVLLLKNCKNSDLSDLSTCFGKFYLKNEYKEEYKRERFTKWMFEKREHNINGSEDVFHEQFSKSVDNILIDFDESMINNNFISFEDFIKEIGLWGTSGSMFGMKLNVDIAKIAKKNKWSLALTKDSKRIYDEIMNSINNKREVKYKSMEKNENSNVRYVVVADMVTYIIESYISYYIEPALNNIPSLFNYKSSKYKLQWFEKRKIQLLKNKHILDIDYSGWDENITLKMIEIVLSKLRNKYNPDFLSALWDYLIWAVHNSTLDGEKIINGLGSGRRWTTLINSLINAAINDLALRMKQQQLLTTVSYGVKFIDLAVLGDDMDAVFDNLSDLVKHIEMLDSMNFTINKLKSKVDKPEFLKINYSLLGISESPFRMLRSVLYSSEDEIDLSKSEQINSRMDNWAKIIGRLNSYYRMLNSIYQPSEYLTKTVVIDMWHVLNKKYNFKFIYRMLMTSSALGGGGFYGLRKIDTYDKGVKYNVSVKIFNGIPILEKRLDEKIKIVNSKSRILEFTKSSILHNMIIKNRNRIGVNVELEKIRMKIAPIYLDLFMMNNQYVISDIPRVSYFRKSMLPNPDGSGLYTSAVLNRGLVDIKTVFSDYIENNFVVDNKGNKFTRNGLYEISFVNWLYMIRRRYSLKMLQMILDDSDDLISMPRELVISKGETAGAMAWLVLKPLIIGTFSNLTSYERYLQLCSSLSHWLKNRNYTKWLYDSDLINVLCLKEYDTRKASDKLKLGFYVSKLLN